MSARPLYLIGDDLTAIAEQIIDAGGELTPELEAQLAQLEGEFESKVERVGLYIHMLQSRSDEARKQADRLTGLARTDHHAAESLKGYLLRCLEAADKRSMVTPLIRVSIAKNSRPSIRWLAAEETIPEAFRRVRYSLDGDAAFRAWKDRGTLPEGFAVEQGQHLRLK